jgi:hypothetical protein
VRGCCLTCSNVAVGKRNAAHLGHTAAREHVVEAHRVPFTAGSRRLIVSSASERCVRCGCRLGDDFDECRRGLPASGCVHPETGKPGAARARSCRRPARLYRRGYARGPLPGLQQHHPDRPAYGGGDGALPDRTRRAAGGRPAAPAEGPVGRLVPSQASKSWGRSRTSAFVAPNPAAVTRGAVRRPDRPRRGGGRPQRPGDRTSCATARSPRH